MDKSKIKSFIILLLALVNAFLLIIVISNVHEAGNAKRYRNDALKKVFAENGITLDSKIALPKKVLPEISLKRDMQKEKDFICRLLGNCTVTNQGGNMFFYQNQKNGEANFRGTGEFEILLASGLVPRGIDPVSTAKSVMKKLGISYSKAPAIVTNETGNTKVTLSCAYDKNDIYNSTVDFQFTSEYLMLIIGSRPLDTEVSVQSTEKYPDSVTVLMNFLDSINRVGNVCSKITDVTVGYFLNAPLPGSCTLRPEWRIETDVGPYYIDGRTGKSETLEFPS
ncbi:MAG: hypothetical protein RSC86_04190 [Oscillospiraceae bacterium]